jgi:hypothetical protein
VTLSFSTSPSVKSFSLTNENALGSATATSSYQSALSWNLCAGLTACSPGAYSVTVRFLDSNNNTLGTVSHSIAYVPAGSSTPVPTTTSASSVVSPSTDPAEQLAALQAELQTLLNQVSTSTSATSATVATPSSQFTRDLKLGLTGSDVKQLQAYLISQNAGTAARALKAHGTTKNFASLTKAALIEFQKKVGIAPAQGYFGPVTRAYVNSHIR